MTAPSTFGAPFDDGLSGWFELVARHDGEQRVTTWIPARDDLRDHDGSLGASALAFAVDSAVGMSAGFAALPRWVVTSDLHIQFLAPARVGPIRAEAAPVRRGRTQVLAEARLYDEGAGDVLVAVATANHGVLTPRKGIALDSMPAGAIRRQPRLGPGRLPPLAEHFGVRVAKPGRAEVDTTPRTRNPWGILHGAVHVLVAEEAARSLVPGRVVDAMVRFVAPLREGPGLASANVVDRVGDRTTVRVEVNDAGADDRVTSLTLLTIERRQ